MNIELEFAYHMHRPNFIGSKILPLNKLKEQNPELFNTYDSKYDNRPHLRTTIVRDQLLWGDVSFSTLHHPRLIFDELRKNGFAQEPKKFFKISINNYSERSLVWLCSNKKAGQSLDQNDCFELIYDGMKLFGLVKDHQYFNIDELPTKAVDYYNSFKDTEKKPLYFQHIPHLLTPDDVDCSNAEIITV
jgi:hypothetical protein